MIYDDGDPLDESCAQETGAAYFEDDELCQCAKRPSVGNVLVSDTEYQAYRECANLLRFMDDPGAAVMLAPPYEEIDGFRCYFTDPFTGQQGVEYGVTPSEALTAALSVVRFRRAQRERAA